MTGSFGPPSWIPEMEFDNDFRPRYWTPGVGHVWLLGGEHLPPLLPGERDIARIVLRLETPDVVAIRARPWMGGIRYRAVDEHEGTTMHMEEGTSKDPLTLAQMLAVVDIVQFGPGRQGGPLIWALREVNLVAGADLETMRDFVTVRSPFYPQLELIHEREAWAWYEEKLAEGERWRWEE